MEIKQSVINTFERVEIPYLELLKKSDKILVANRFTGESCYTNYLVAYLIRWVYRTNDNFDRGDCKIKVGDFDRIRYFVLDQDKDAYNICLD